MSTQPPKSKDLLVFFVRRDTTCAECGDELWQGRFVTLEEKGALCLSCADLDHLLFLPSGDAALTRRATRHSHLHAKVLQWSRTRKQYERQGVLVETEALQKAEEECLSDAEVREKRREREAEKRAHLDQQFMSEFAGNILELFPRCSAETAGKIAQHACLKYSGRVGRSAAAKHFAPQAITLAVRAHVRHQYTPYDELLLEGHGRREARVMVGNEVDLVLDGWQKDPSAPTG